MIPTIAHLPEIIAALPDEMRDLCNRLLYVERTAGHAVVPEPMRPWVERHFGSVANVYDQTIIKVTNLVTLDTASFNPLRARRPLERYSSPSSGESGDRGAYDAELEQAIAERTSPQSMFRHPLSQTSADVFGRIRGEHCLSASNVAKYDSWHGLVIFDEPHPLRFSRFQLRDYLSVALRWLLAAHEYDPSACYPLITWNCLWKSGASVTHGHMQMVLSRAMASGRVERWRRDALDYQGCSQQNLDADLWRVSASLGLSCAAPDEHDDTVCGYASLTPLKDREITLLDMTIPKSDPWHALVHGGGMAGGDQGSLLALFEPLWDATYRVLRHLIDRQGVRSFNLAVVLPPLCPTSEPWDGLPVRVRVVDRGDPLSPLVSIGAMEVFAHSIISVDPFEVAALLRGESC